ncbi:MAG: hypothetical protein PHV88_07880, partial [Eubacteriales bacterium]|nr:hypothetical protein [Eubacteriales bacterium]
IEIVQGSEDAVQGTVISVKGITIDIVVTLNVDVLTVALPDISPQTSDPGTVLQLILLIGATATVVPAVNKRK